MEGAELINWTQVGERTSPLGSCKKKLNTEAQHMEEGGINYWNPN